MDCCLLSTMVKCTFLEEEDERVKFKMLLLSDSKAHHFPAQTTASSVSFQDRDIALTTLRNKMDEEDLAGLRTPISLIPNPFPTGLVKKINKSSYSAP